MRLFTFALLLTLFIAPACQQEKTTQEEQSAASEVFAVNTDKNEELEYEYLRIYPIIGSEEFITGNEGIQNFQTLGEAITNDRFRITEKKPYGRFSDQGAVNSLTVQNKTDEAVFLMAGDVLQGGNQDRVIGEDQVIAAASINDIPVFCVEKGRWSPHAEQDGEQTDKKPIYAFRGYYNVAASEVRRSVKHSKNQSEVWEKVGKVTAINNAEASTGTYAALENSDQFTETRTSYLRFFSDKFEEQKKAIGMVAVSGNRVIGTDVFGHPNLFQRQYEALLHSYITEAISSGAVPEMSEQKAQAYANSLQRTFKKQKDNPSYRFDYNGQMIHFTDLPE